MLVKTGVDQQKLANEAAYRKDAVIFSLLANVVHGDARVVISLVGRCDNLTQDGLRKAPQAVSFSESFTSFPSKFGLFNLVANLALPANFCFFLPPNFAKNRSFVSLRDLPQSPLSHIVSLRAE